MEQAVIVAVLSDPTLLPSITTILSPDDFFKQSHREIFTILSAMEIDHIDSLSVGDKLTGQVREYFTTLVKDSDQILPSLTNIMFYAEQIRGDSRLRNGIELGREIIAACLEPNIPPAAALQKLEDMFSRFVQQRINADPSDISTEEAFEAFAESLGTRVSRNEGVRTGFYNLDMILHDLEGLIILAARPSLGKTALAINIARNIAADNHKVLFFSLEQKQEQVFERMLSSESSVNLEEITTGAFMADDNAISAVRRARGALLPIMQNMHIDDTGGVPLAYITSISRKKSIEWGKIDLIIVDYLHLMAVDNSQTKTDALGEAVKGLRDLGKELGCPVILLSQLNRQGENSGEGKKARRPELSDLRGSGDIEQSADMVLFLYRDSYYDDHGYVPDEDFVEVLIRKNRNGRTGFTNLKWIPRFVRFGDM